MKRPYYFKSGAILISMVMLILLISFCGDACMWGIVLLLLIGGLILLYSLITQLRNAIIKPAHRLYAKDFSLKFMATLMGFFLILGTLLYLYVFYIVAHDSDVESDVGHPIDFSNAEYLLRSLICSLDLFMLDVDSNLLDRLDSHACLKGWLSIQAVLSFACTLGVFVGLVYSRLHAYYRLNYLTKINNNRNHLYLFFGNNTPSELLIKDIVKNDSKAIAVIIDEATVNEDNNDEWEGIVGLIAHKHKVFKTAKKIGAHVAIASEQLDDIDSEIADREDFDAFGYLGLSKIKKFIDHLTQMAKQEANAPQRQSEITTGVSTQTTDHPQLHIFFMGEDEELNIRNIIALSKDTTIKSVAKTKELDHRIYCHARYNGPNRVIQDVALKNNLNIKIVDSSHIAVESLKINKEYHPVNVVKVSNNCLTAVDTPLKTLIIGFGEVGRDAFRFLYEFGAFVDSHNPNVRNPFECVIVDKEMESKKGAFVSMMPGIFNRESHSRNIISFKSIDYNHIDFYSDVLNKKFLQEINYIVISIGNNDEAIALAARIFNHIRRVREDLSNLRIFVRCTDDKKVEVMQKIADHYNYGYGNGTRNHPVINVFGQPNMTYTYDLVVNDRLVKEGKIFYENYRVFSGERDSWDVRHKKLTETETPNIEKLRKLRRQESQDKANALHAGTKMILLKKAMDALAKEYNTALDWHSFYLNYFNKADGSANVKELQKQRYYPGLSKRENEIIRHLAMLEHLRWNAAHELMGYVFNKDGKECDERTMKHNCLCSWDKLDEQSDMITDWSCDYKKYDFCVVDTTIALSNVSDNSPN